MLRRLIPALAVALFALPFALAEDKKPAEKPEAKADKESGSFKDTEKDFLEKIKGAKSVDDRKEVLETYAGKFMALAEKDPKAPEAVEALFYVIRMGQPSAVKALGMLKNHPDSPKMKEVIKVVSRRNDAPAIDLLKAVLKQSKDKKMQAQACNALKSLHEKAAQTGTRIKDNEALRERMEKAQGKEAVEKLVSGIEEHQKAGKEYAKLLEEKYAGVLSIPQEGKAAPEVVSKNLEGKESKLSALKGKVVVLDVWATWCPPCRAMIPHTRELVKKHEGKPFAFVSVSADAKKETLKDFVEKTPMPWTHWWEGTGGMISDWEIEAFPTIFVLDHKGVIRKKFVGANSKALEELVETLLEEAAKDAKSSS